jgi:hypothetical protein
MLMERQIVKVIRLCRICITGIECELHSCHGFGRLGARRGLVEPREWSWLSRLSLLSLPMGERCGIGGNVDPYFSSSESDVISRVSARSAKRPVLFDQSSFNEKMITEECRHRMKYT